MKNICCDSLGLCTSGIIWLGDIHTAPLKVSCVSRIQATSIDRKLEIVEPFFFQADIYLFKINNGDTKRRCKIGSKLTL